MHYHTNLIARENVPQIDIDLDINKLTQKYSFQDKIFVSSSILAHVTILLVRSNTVTSAFLFIIRAE